MKSAKRPVEYCRTLVVSCKFRLKSTKIANRYAGYDFSGKKYRILHFDSRKNIEKMVDSFKTIFSHMYDTKVHVPFEMKIILFSA